MKTTFLKHSIILIVSVACINSVNAQGVHIQHSPSAYSNSDYYMYVDDDSSVNPVQTLITYRKGLERYDIKMAQDKVTEMYVNNRKIPADSFYVYNGLINKIKEQIKKDRIQAAEDMKQAEVDRVQAEKDQQQAVKDQQQAELDRKQAEEDRKGAVKDQEQAEEDRKGAVKDQEQAGKDQQQAEEDRKQALLDMDQAKKDQVQAGKDQEQAVIDRKQAEEDRKQAEEDKRMVKSLMDEVVKENIVTDEKSISRLVLNDEEFTVNGKKQSEELHAKFKAKFLKKPGYSICYGGYTSGYGIFINNDDSKKKQ